MKRACLSFLLLSSVTTNVVNAQTPGAGGYQYDAYGQLVNNYSQTTPTTNQPPGLQVVTVSQRQAGVSTILGGTVVPFREVTLNAEIPGRVEKRRSSTGHVCSVVLRCDLENVLWNFPAV